MIHQNYWRLGLACLFATLAMIVLIHPAFAVPKAPHSISRAEIKQMVVEEAQNSIVPPALALAVAKVESDFNPSALSSAGARGVMQIMPKTAKDEFGVNEDELWKARLNIQLGIDYLAKLRKQYGGKWDLALSHYNGGTLKGKGSNAQPHSYTTNYVRMVQRWRQRYADQNQVWTVAANNSDSAWRDRESTWEPSTRGRIQRKWRKNSNRSSDRYWDREVAFNEARDFDEACRKSSSKAAWREYDQFSAPFARGFNQRSQAYNRRGFGQGYRSKVRFWRDRPYRRARSYRPYRRDYYAEIGRASGLEERRQRAAKTLDDFSANFRRRVYWRNG